MRLPAQGAAVVVAFLTAFSATAASRPSREISTNAITGFGTYTYDGAGNITSIGDSQAKDLFTYDNFGRLQTAAVRNAPAQSYTYDQWGNIRTITTAGNPVVQKLGVKKETNQITEAFDEFGQPNNVVGTYDGRGNLTSYNSGSFAYDGLEMAKEATVDGVRRFHVYSAGDERVVTIRRVGSTPAGSDWTIRDAAGRVLRRLTETNGNLAWTEDYVYRGGLLLATAVPGPEKVRHIHVDHLGTPRLMTGNGGVQLAEHHYQPFGRELPSSTNDGEKAKFTGHERDADTLDYMHARYYDPYIGRFLSVDPVLDAKAALFGPQMWNRYSYVRNNPVNATDPTGRREAVVYGQTLNVEPGYAVVLRNNETKEISHVAIIGGFEEKDGQLQALVYENAPQQPQRVGAAALKDTKAHQPQLINSNSEAAGGGLWNVKNQEVAAVRKNEALMTGTLTTRPFTESEVRAAVDAIGAVTYDNSVSGATGSLTDCAGYANQVLVNLDGTFISRGWITGPWSLTEWRENAEN